MNTDKEYGEHEAEECEGVKEGFGAVREYLGHEGKLAEEGRT